jgi:hypothetical protein
MIAVRVTVAVLTVAVLRLLRLGKGDPTYTT